MVDLVYFLSVGNIAFITRFQLTTMFVSLDTDVFDVRKNDTPEIIDRSILIIDR